jgi:hypothetical protein
LVWAAIVAIVAFVRFVPIVYGLMLIGGVAWISLVATFNSSAQTAVPSWVRGRSLGVYMLAFQGSIAAGSAFWGLIADHTSIEWALSAAASGMTVALLAALRFPLPAGEGPDLTPSLHWPSPIIADEPDPEYGPALITVEYSVEPNRAAEFAAAVEKLEGSRRRDGAFRWGIFRDIADPARWVETFLVESWAEHLRQHERVTNDDRAIEDNVRALLKKGTTPTVAHLIWAQSPMLPDHSILK